MFCNYYILNYCACKYSILMIYLFISSSSRNALFYDRSWFSSFWCIRGVIMSKRAYNTIDTRQIAVYLSDMTECMIAPSGYG